MFCVGFSVQPGGAGKTLSGLAETSGEYGIVCCELWLASRQAGGGFTPGSHSSLKHTFGRRLRAAGVSFEDRQDLLGHLAGRITTHYSAAELSKLMDAANSVVARDCQRPELVVIRRLSVS